MRSHWLHSMLFLCCRNVFIHTSTTDCCTLADVFSIGVRKEEEIGDKWPEVLSISSSYTETAFRSSIIYLQIYKTLTIPSWGEICTNPYWVRNTLFCYVASLTTGPQLLPKWGPQRVETSSFSFNFPYPVLSCSCLRLLSRLPNPSILPSKKCFRQQFPCKMWTFFPPWLHVILRFSNEGLNWSSPSFSSAKFKKLCLFSHIFRRAQFSAPYRAIFQTVARHYLLS